MSYSVRCECGWRGQRWDTPEEAAVEYGIHAAGVPGHTSATIEEGGGVQAEVRRVEGGGEDA